MRPSLAPEGLMGQSLIYLWEIKQINVSSSLLSNRMIKSYRMVFLWKTWLHEPSPQTRLTGRRQWGDACSICSQLPHLPRALNTPSPPALRPLAQATLCQSRSLPECPKLAAWT